ncbi:GPI ethanolamine phosphate transferase 2 isoform X2 [Phalaenopsis equestris]|uniref:GPI ethanolamine phosphate transferase 2 isoform X2 n=1 Tax=Phalaenopsis equestris TaxID=78828 RepID=UPI0009E3B5D7|nr:GPI ethanolamine phosphate transferase 2 isoform X2 [Phalaenopsis equestris]
MATPSMSCSRLACYTSAATLLQILGLWLFVSGFFPVKPTVPGFSGPESYRMPTCEDVLEDEKGHLPPDQLAKMYMVIDGLPAEFVIGRGSQPPEKSLMEAMPYTQSLLSERKALAFHAKAAPPTVTMPRLKAMVSGAIGGFLDVVFNFNTNAFLDDNLLDQFHKIGWKLVMFGDDTWIKLFPSLFTRYDGVNSFYVKDTVEVDFNVSRHLEVELAANDWKLMILHYLGLDHAGHIGGRHSLLMASKLKEMDDAIRLIHTHNALNGDDYGRHTLLVVVSDHGMTLRGNHGGSSNEETDSLVLLVDLWSESPIFPLSMNNEVFQVDVAPTLALLFGVPIPKDNVGVLLIEAFNSLEDEHKLRALELNSWQLIRLLQVHLPHLLCQELRDSASSDQALQSKEFLGNIREKLHHLYSKAKAAHKLWKLSEHDSSRTFANSTNFNAAVAAYYDFLRCGSEWLSHKATDKPIRWILSGVVILLLSSVLLLYILFLQFKDHEIEIKFSSALKNCNLMWHLDEAFVSIGTFLHIFSLGASSMVEEEQYTWHFLTSTLFSILFYMTILPLLKERKTVSVEMNKEEKLDFNLSLTSRARAARGAINVIFVKPFQTYYQIYSLMIVLICGSILRGWHQGGVNWAHLPDISKWLEQAGSSTMKALEITSLLSLMMLSLFALSLLKSRTRYICIASLGIIVLGFLVLLHIIENRPINHSNSIVQIFYFSSGFLVFGTFMISPWIMPLHCHKNIFPKKSSGSHSSDLDIDGTLVGVQNSLYLIGVMNVSSWCLLQLLLQQPVNAVPILLIFVRTMASVIYFSAGQHRQLVEVAAIYFLGMAGHFSMGNSNTLATIDVAGAFIGVSSYSIVFPSILMFIITFSSPILSYLSMVVSISTKNIMNLSLSASPDLSRLLKLLIAFPCLLPLVLNSAVLVAFTIILLVMRNHLFVWSVFSPKYLYVCAGTASVYIGVFVVAATVFYTCTVFFFRAKLLKSGGS